MVLAPRSTQLSTTYRNGTKVVGLNRKGFGGRGLYLFGEKQEFELDVLEEFLGPGDNFIDVGANVGIYSMKAASLVGDKGMVLSFEPYPFTAHRLLENSLINGFKNVRIRVCCASDVDGSTLFYLAGNMPNSFSIDPKPDCGVFNVATARIDTVVKNEGMEALTLIKIDAEGAENKVLAGSANVIDRFKPTIILEATISSFEVPEGYARYRIPNSINRILIHPSSKHFQLVDRLKLASC